MAKRKIVRVNKWMDNIWRPHKENRLSEGEFLDAALDNAGAEGDDPGNFYSSTEGHLRLF